MSSPWSAEIWRITGLLALGLVFGLIIDHVFFTWFAVILGYLIWHLRQLHRLESWLVISKKLSPPEGYGLWEDIFHQLYLLQQRNRKSKKRLAAYLSRFQNLTKALPDATVVLRANGEIEWFNEAAEQFLGLHAPQDIGQRIDNLIRYPAFVEHLQAERFDEPVEFPSPVNEDLMLSARVVAYGQEQRLLVVRDVTRVHLLERMRRDFVANVSHELRTPLTVVNGYLETMVDATDPALAPWRRSLDLMQEQGRRMNSIVEDLLLLSRLETDNNEQKNEVINVPLMLAFIREEATALSGEKQHKIELDMQQDLQLWGHETHLRSAFTNLVTNAVRYTPPGGSIRIGWHVLGDKVVFSVRDAGEGIAASHIPRLTERFYRVDAGRSRQSGGTGLGLAIVKHVVERHDGYLVIESTLGAGSLFSCVFPLERVR